MVEHEQTTKKHARKVRVSKSITLVKTCIEKLMLQKNGKLKPQELLKYAKPNTSPLHKYFCWNNTVAGEKWRVHQARNLINWVTVEIVTGQKTRAFVNVKTENNGQTYMTINSVLEDSKLKKQLLENSLKELRYWQQQYRMLSELSLIFKAIDKTEKKIHKS